MIYPGKLLRIVTGGFAGKLVRVKEYYNSPSTGMQIVLQCQRDGKWVDFVRESEQAVRAMCEEVK
jgi:hypothetical protein